MPHSAPPTSVLWLELYEAEDNLELISVSERHVPCVTGTQTAGVLAANSNREKTERLSHLITGKGPFCVCDSYGCPIALDRLFLFAGSGWAGIVLIRKEMDRVVLSALVTGGDKAEYYLEAVFCENLFPGSH